MKTFKQHLEEDLAAVQKANRKKEASMKRLSKEKKSRHVKKIGITRKRKS